MESNSWSIGEFDADKVYSYLRKKPLGLIYFMDDSWISWLDENGKTYETNFMKAHLLLYGKTWYEDKFGATMCDSEIYRVYKEKFRNFDDPDKKPAHFDFRNEKVQQLLDPLYISSITWREFISKILACYEKEKYKIIHDWYRYALYCIFDGIEINQNWVMSPD